MTGAARAPLKQRATITGARLYSEDARALAIEDAVRTLERELRQHDVLAADHLDVHQRIAIERVLWDLIDHAMAHCFARRGPCW